MICNYKMTILSIVVTTSMMEMVSSQATFTETIGFCRGGSTMWPGLDTLWECGETEQRGVREQLTKSQCEAKCAAEPNCASFGRKPKELSDCCLFMEGNTGNGNNKRRCYLKDPVDCVGSWGEFGDCSSTCGGGSQTKTYTVQTQASNGGAACPAVQTETQACNTGPCPAECDITSWEKFPLEVYCRKGGAQFPNNGYKDQVDQAECEAFCVENNECAGYLHRHSPHLCKGQCHIRPGKPDKDQKPTPLSCIYGPAGAGYSFYSKPNPWEQNGFVLITTNKGPGDCGTIKQCLFGDEATILAACATHDCNLIQWCPADGGVVPAPSCHDRHGGQARACIYSGCSSCTETSCNFNRSPHAMSGSAKIGHWYTYFKSVARRNVEQGAASDSSYYKDPESEIIVDQYSMNAQQSLELEF